MTNAFWRGELSACHVMSCLLVRCFWIRVGFFIDFWLILLFYHWLFFPVYVWHMVSYVTPPKWWLKRGGFCFLAKSTLRDKVLKIFLMGIFLFLYCPSFCRQESVVLRKYSQWKNWITVWHSSQQLKCKKTAFAFLDCYWRCHIKLGSNIGCVSFLPYSIAICHATFHSTSIFICTWSKK